MLVESNYIHNAFGAGILVFGHFDGANTNLTFARNTMLWNGCGQSTNDHGGISFIRLGSSGVIHNNIFATCPGTPVFFEAVPGAMAEWQVSSNFIDGQNASLLVVDTPVVESTVNASGISLRASCATPNAQLVYSLDGSLPTQASLVWPSDGVLHLPPRSVAVNVKAFPNAATRHVSSSGLYIESASAGGVFCSCSIALGGCDAM